ncbi:12350_t:CDS:2 [Gigaspora margarita]|uniref:12350_t:CDS:1 n=1 Tax=Gigaspora margarita TaxID=4874 RepID=A0ABM8W3M4_GIGMA|nr:12350_t:CDS:2 [Gigaspora margarita]
MSNYVFQAYTIYDETPKLSSSSAGVISYHPTINYYDFRTTLGDDIISNVLHIMQSDIPTVVNYYDYREGYNNDDCSPYLLSFAPYGQKNSVIVNYWDYRPNDFPEQPVNHIIDFGERPPITGRENGRTYHQCNICMKKFKSPEIWRKHFQKDSCIRRATI